MEQGRLGEPLVYIVHHKYKKARALRSCQSLQASTLRNALQLLLQRRCIHPTLFPVEERADRSYFSGFLRAGRYCAGVEAVSLRLGR